MKVRFILNPVSGKNKTSAQERAAGIKSVFPKAEVVFTKAPGHATELAREAADHNFDAVIAVGGDLSLIHI